MSFLYIFSRLCQLQHFSKLFYRVYKKHGFRIFKCIHASGHSYRSSCIQNKTMDIKIYDILSFLRVYCCNLVIFRCMFPPSNFLYLLVKYSRMINSLLKLLLVEISRLQILLSGYLLDNFFIPLEFIMLTPIYNYICVLPPANQTGAVSYFTQ